MYLNADLRFDDPAALVGQHGGTIVTEARSLPFDVYPLRDYVAPGKKLSAHA